MQKGVRTLWVSFSSSNKLVSNDSMDSQTVAHYPRSTRKDGGGRVMMKDAAENQSQSSSIQKRQSILISRSTNRQK